MCSEGSARVLELAALGAEFTRDAAGALSLTREGGHSHRRIVHAADLTGREIERALLAAATASSNIQFFEHFSAVDLITSEVRSLVPAAVASHAVCHPPMARAHLQHDRLWLGGLASWRRPSALGVLAGEVEV